MKDLFSLQKAGLIVSAVILLPCVSMVNVEMDHFSKHPEGDGASYCIVILMREMVSDGLQVIHMASFRWQM